MQSFEPQLCQVCQAMLFIKIREFWSLTMPTMLTFNICKVLGLNYAKYAKLCFHKNSQILEHNYAKYAKLCFHNNSQILELNYANYANLLERIT